jgi:hypothetical protein
MPLEKDSAATIDGRLNRRNVQIGVARAGHDDGLRRDGPGKSGHGAYHRNQCSV